MSKTSLLLVGVLSICGFAVAGTKSYNITLPAAAKAGALQLRRGRLHVENRRHQRHFMEPHTRKTFTTPVKVETAPRKFNYTAVETAPDGGGERITSIDLGGSATQIEFTK